MPTHLLFTAGKRFVSPSLNSRSSRYLIYIPIAQTDQILHVIRLLPSSLYPHTSLPPAVNLPYWLTKYCSLRVIHQLILLGTLSEVC